MSEIPPIFHSAETDEPFSHCLTCETALNKLTAPYTISKVFRGPECVFEYAMCLPCRREISNDFSDESKRNIETFFNRRVNLDHRSQTLAGSEHHTDWMRSCLTCGKSASQITEYSIASMAFTNTMVFDPFPMMVCSECEREIHDQLSKSTRDQWDKFVSTYFDGPPVESLSPTGGVPVLV